MSKTEAPLTSSVSLKKEEARLHLVARKFGKILSASLVPSFERRSYCATVNFCSSAAAGGNWIEYADSPREAVRNVLQRIADYQKKK